MGKSTSQKQARFRAKNINIEKEGLLCEKKVMDSSREHNNPKCLCS